MNCPFYGRAMYGKVYPPVMFLLVDTKGNQCGLVADAHAPCMMEANGEEVDWKTCPVVKEVRLEQI
ncbi:MAG TPA: hypothetical protein VGG62_12155 [Terracidiphilus sp.]|jgi:hypothetical protein